jgi:hypothetical protein
MAISDWTLAGIAFALTLLTCAAMRALIGGGRWTVVACLGAGVVVTPAVVFLGFHAAGGVVGGRNSQLVFLFAWIAGIGASALFARAAHGRRGSS